MRTTPIRTALLIAGLLALAPSSARAQKRLLVCDDFNDRVMSFLHSDGSLDDADFIVDAGGSPFDFETPREALQVGNEIWVVDAEVDAIHRFDSSGAWSATISGGLDDCRGLAFDGSTVYVANNGTAGGAPGRAVIRISTSGTVLGSFPVQGGEVQDVCFYQGELLLPDPTNDRIDRYTTAGTFQGSITGPGTPLTAPQQVFAPTGTGQALIGTLGPANIGVHVLDNGFTPTLFTAFSFFGIVGVGEDGNGDYLVAGSSGMVQLTPSGGFAFLIIPGGASPQLVSSFDPPGPTSPTIYCTAKQTSCGSTPTIGGPSATASLSAGSGSYDVTCGPVPSGAIPGILFYSSAGPLMNPIAVPFGFLCVTPGSQLFRVPPAVLPVGSGCAASYTFDFGNYLATQTVDPFLVAGAQVDMQAWFRDPPAVGGADYSNAMSFTLVP